MSENIIEKIQRKKMKRRSFLKWSGAVAAPAIIGSSTAVSNKLKITAETTDEATEEKVITTCGTLNCGGRCLIKAHLKDGVITHLSTDTKEDTFDLPQLRACVRGRGYRQFFYNPDRLKRPMKRVGKRGEGKFEEISWEEAIDYIAEELTRITEEHGPSCRYSNYASGHSGSIIGAGNMAQKLFGLTGGYLGYHNSYSSAQTSTATPYTYGTTETGSTLNTLSDSKLIILWGHNPVETRFGLTDFYVKKAKENGVKIVVIDPRKSDTAVALADEWIPIAPTTDTAMMDAMMYVIISENLYDKKFVDKHCIGFDEEHMPEDVPEGESLKSYILGEKDGVPKTPEWAEEICKVPAGTIQNLAREYATNKPSALMQGYGPQRQAFGEQFTRGGTILAAITGNVGVRGGWASGQGSINLVTTTPVPKGENPLGELTIPCFLWTDAVVRGTEMGEEDGVKGLPDGQDTLPSNMKVMFNLAGNTLINQHADCNKTAEILQDESLLELIVVSEVFMTPSAKFADILLPSNTFMERWDIGSTWAPSQHAILSEKCIESMYDSKSDYEWLTMLAKKLGVEEEFTEGRSQLDWVKWSIEESRKEDPNFPTFEEFRENGVYQPSVEENTVIAFEKEIKDPDNNKFETPSGKIEIFSKDLWDMDNHEEIPAIPKHVHSWEGPEDPLIEEYPLQLIGWHYKRRCHSSFDNNKWLEEIGPQVLWMNESDASDRNINDGDMVKIFNERGEIQMPVEVTNRMMPGVAAIPQGAWWDPDENGVDQRGNINTLTGYRPSPLAKGNPQHTNLCEIEKL
ncbi:molybdopterin-dependent oxidoreductase [Virgibacillus sp. NKC19-3]|uniref:DMSO/selenate family reductase complex A subunit n=1 Tax=Virgibacillus saliphilus TaxID=2831674 RepID=UPI001C9A35A9|nr:DMSO/selenate family reductase complex A subunit [Virgibacillus sp. NKC19-3]MBY7142064.1 molybdopterin-dependent oxidoreductase [Virgibacillus sp. NKC19-3]